MSGKLLIFSAPSGAGKTTIVRWLMGTHPEFRLHFSVSCTTRRPRLGEHDGVDYFFVGEEDFRKKIAEGAFIEYEEVYAGRFYGTLRSQVDAQLRQGENIIFDVDVAGGCNIKRQYGAQAMSIFIQPPSINELRRRLLLRGTDTAEAVDNRVAKAAKEMLFAEKYDHIVVNDNLARAESEVYKLVKAFLREG
ncbi:MAG: guanylate kinase [Prevotella sp.]|nr:guanylate kinase [Prevotella sp.]